MPQQMRHPPLTFTWPPSILAAKPAVRRETSPSIRGTRRTSSRRFHIARPLSGDTRREEVERREAHEDLESLAGRAVPGCALTMGAAAHATDVPKQLTNYIGCVNDPLPGPLA